MYQKFIMKFKFSFYIIGALGTIYFVFMMWLQAVKEYDMSFDVTNYPNSEAIQRAPGMKYVLQWTSPDREPFVYLGKGQQMFTKKKCSTKNCYITSKRGLLNDITEFDVVLFHGPEIVDKSKSELPKKRSAHQRYIFASMESSANYPVPDERYDDVFNATWTYKLNSDIYYGYIIIKNQTGDVIGPSAVMPWIDIADMLPIKDNIKVKLENKKIAAAWFVSNCEPHMGRTKMAKLLIEELEKINMTVDVYGKCGTKKCPRDSMADCLNKLQRDYYFYFAFENSLSDDYVTEKLLHALQNYAVPVVYGGANYTRFMPDGIYLNALHKSAAELANEMLKIISDKDKYNNFFKWHNHYSYHSPEKSIDTDPYCNFCNYINKIPTVSYKIDNFKDWWNII